MSLGQLVRRTVISDAFGALVTTTTVGANQALDVNVVASVGGAGVQYTEGDTDATLVGTIMMAENSLSPDEARPLQVDNSDYLKVNIAAVDHAPSIPVDVVGSVEIKNDVGSPITVSVSSIVATESEGGLGAGGLPGNASLAGFNDGSNMQAARVYDTDSGAGAEYTLGVNIRAAASGGSVAIPGDASNGLDVDVTRTPKASTATKTATTVSTTAVQILASNANRKSFLVTNNETNPVYIGYDNTVTTSGANYGHKLTSGGSWTDDVYTGAIYAICGAVIASQNVVVTEFT